MDQSLYITFLYSCNYLSMLWVKCLFIWYLSVFKPLEFKKDYVKPELFLFEAGDDGSLMMLCVSSGFWEIQTPRQ